VEHSENTERNRDRAELAKECSHGLVLNYCATLVTVFLATQTLETIPHLVLIAALGRTPCSLSLKELVFLTNFPATTERQLATTPR
jgi:hypothetical protein